MQDQDLLQANAELLWYTEKVFLNLRMNENP